MLTTLSQASYLAAAAVTGHHGGYAPWIEELYNRDVTGGCQATPLLYCPGDPNMREQMALFLVKTFGMRLYGP